MAITSIRVRGARQHNLKNISVEIPRNTLTVITGLSGSGKSSLAFDTIYAEGQRRYVETLSAYARQFLDQMERPDVDAIDGLSPAIAIEQKTTTRNPRSTVGTITEIYDYLRLLYSSVGVPHCPNCGREISRQSAEQIVQQVMSLKPEERVMLLAPVVFTMGILATRRRGAAGCPQSKAPVPWFLLGFLAMILVNSSGILSTAWTARLVVVNQFLLALALVAMGLETSIGKLRAAGLRPFLLGSGAWCFISILSLSLIRLFYW